MLPTSSTPPAIDGSPSFAAQFGGPLPRELREAAESMCAEEFHARYAPTSGPLRLGTWQCVDAARPGPQPRNYQATIAVAERIGTSTAVASGPIAALTAMLHERGLPVETLQFHQLRADGGTATFIRGTDGVEVEWAMGWSDDSTQSALRAVIACANRLCSATIRPAPR